MRKFILQNKVAIIAVALVMCVSFGFTVIANSNEDTILDRIVMTYLNLKTSEVKDIDVGKAEVGMNSMLIEDHFPYFRINDGMYTGKDIYTSGSLTVDGETKTGKIHNGGTVTDATSTMEIAFTLTAAQVCDSSVITVNSGCSAETAACAVAASLDITFPATSTLFADCLDDDGDSTEFLFYNSSPTAASTTEMVPGTGGFLYEPDGQNVLIGGGNAVKVFIQRVDTFESNEDYIIIIDENIAG